MEQLTIKMQLTRTKQRCPHHPKKLFAEHQIHSAFLLLEKIPQAGLHLASSEKNWRYFGGAIVEPVSF